MLHDEGNSRARIARAARAGRRDSEAQRLRLAVPKLLVIVGVLLCTGRAAAFEEPPMCTEPVEDHPWSSADARQDVCIAPDPALELMLPAVSGADASAARTSFERAQALYQSGDLDEAVLHLRVVERSLPRVADRIALRRGALLEQLGLPAQAREAYDVARQSPDRGVATAAEIAEARCMLEASDKAGELALQSLVRRYPNLGERYALRLSLARMRERSGQLGAAATLLRSIDLEAPASREAKEARDALSTLAARGVNARPLSGLELADRTERLWRDADVEGATASGIIVTSVLDFARTSHALPMQMPQATHPERPRYCCEAIAIGAGHA